MNCLSFAYSYENMEAALRLAAEAFENGEVPVGCVVTDSSGRIIGRGRNRCEENKDGTSHAEIEAIRAAGIAKGDWRLDGCILYVTLEPCPMCAGAIINSRISTVVYGAKNEHSGSCGSIIDLFSENYNHRPKVYPGIFAEKSRELLRRFFEKERKNA